MFSRFLFVHLKSFTYTIWLLKNDPQGACFLIYNRQYTLNQHDHQDYIAYRWFGILINFKIIPISYNEGVRITSAGHLVNALLS